jgi:hypothetical protein
MGPFAALTVGALLAAPVAGAEPPRPFRLRASLVAAGAFPSVGVDRSEDAYLHLDLELELPLEGPFTVGLRGMPVELYRAPGRPWIYGIGFGITSRAYLEGSVHLGPFAGLAVSTVRTNRTFVGNSSRLNFLSQLAVGYQSPAHWSVAATFEHLSNAFTTDQNHGINGLGLSAGVDW